LSELIQVELPDEQVIWAMIADDGPQDVGLRDGVHRLKGLTEAIQAVAHNVREALPAIRPDEVTVGFGIELAVGEGGLVAALSGISGKATITVTLGWKSGPEKRPG
jgi:hypothetical protein